MAKTNEEVRKTLGLNAIDYLESCEKDIFKDIMVIAKKGKPQDAVKLKALQGLYNKIRPDRTKLDLDVKATAPYEVLVSNLARGEDAKCKGKKE